MPKFSAHNFPRASFGAAPSGLDHGMGSAGEGYVTEDPQLADFPEVLHPMVVLQQVSIIDRNLEVVSFNQDLDLGTKHGNSQNM